MSVMGELTSEVVMFMVGNRSAKDSKDLRRVMLAFHSTFILSREMQQRRRARLFSGPLRPFNNSSISIRHRRESDLC